jgi:speckle-type POZ protein
MATTAPAAARTNLSVEFIVKPKEDLYLGGSLRKLPRVSKGEPYPCQMQKNQNFSCLFRHYAKHNGLRKEDLIFSFVDELSPDQTPETSHLMPQDEIWVEHRPLFEIEKKSAEPKQNVYSEQFRVLFETGDHYDVAFFVGTSSEKIKAHKGILSARSDYFEAMFRKGSMAESTQKEIRIEPNPHTTITSFKQMLEFIYTNTVRGLEDCDADAMVALLIIANEYLLEDLKDFCESFAARVLSFENIGRLMLLSAGNTAESTLREACAYFVLENKVDLAQDQQFRQEIEHSPELGLLLFEYSLPKDISEGYGPDGSKRRRISGADVPPPAPQNSISNTI